MPTAVAAIIAFILALVFHIAGGKLSQYVTDAELAGFIFLVITLAAPWPWGLRGWRT